jgi:cytochrome P450
VDSANRDEGRWHDPERFDIDREDLDRITAGGRHFCLGASLARLELRIWIEETLARGADMQLEGPGGRMQSLFLNQWKSLPVMLRG